MKKIAKWLSEHAVVLGDGGRESVVHLWCIVISFVLMTFFGIMGWKGDAFMWLCGVLYLGGTVLPPIIAAISFSNASVESILPVSRAVNKFISTI